mmetsp:Transcript_9375/g.16609  ORF Transcript_9375/g.16609 Transcript_9375/m.16609 type:complete len:554 (+) Transcript_9375:86-1747(+)|eukprot:CAMPEP_0197703774 /NCGR_PEP_ID=MMETSP1338-20131121/125605_1 /TAXON_ID=43686 ORGANISM="Pelagodinium beii, Strain RCC1491" /NCGR_SAMPLE_ID=MMETSP1338 /ASSEMBLY_ACC=CAM_ASM_000754 /LENGTH=553 /DNA_ID=CAMNT_0043287673 /DNA_START=68 /DNA_END=1729 /DNA_ORIENTATION=+
MDAFHKQCLELKAAGQHSDASRILSVKDILKSISDAGQVVQLLSCTREQITAAKRVVDSIVQEGMHKEFRPMEVYESGSFKKGTALRYNFDIDLVVKLRDFAFRQMDDYFTRSRAVLLNTFGCDISFQRDSTHRCLKFEVGDLEFDLLFTGDPAMRRSNTSDTYYSLAVVNEVDEEIIRAKHEYPVFHALVLLVKHWRNSFENKIKSYYIELLCLKLMRTGQFGRSTLRDGFFHFLKHCMEAEWFDVANLNPLAEPRRLKLLGTALAEIQKQAEELLQSYFGAGRFLPEVASLTSENELQAMRAAIMDCHRTSMADKTNQGATSATYSREPEWEGEHRLVARGKYTKGRSGECVVKWFKSGTVFEDTFWQKDLNAVQKAAEIVDAFNLTGRVKDTIFINRPAVWIQCETHAKLLVEPMLADFRKFNSNTGFVNEGCDIMQALSHFSYHYTNGQCLLCDLQGSCGGGYTLTDPVVLSIGQDYGLTDLGQRGIENFFVTHQCSNHCSRGWKKARAEAHFTPQEGSLMLAPGQRQQAGPRFQPSSRMPAFEEESSD